MASTAKPRFGDLVENGWASEENPTRRGFFVREIRNGARRTWEITDGKGKFWRCPLDSDHKLTWAPTARPSPGVSREEVARVDICEVCNKPILADQARATVNGPDIGADFDGPADVHDACVHAPPADTSSEEAAEEVYRAMQWAATRSEGKAPPAWVERGNSHAQEEARRATWAILAALSLPRPASDKGPSLPPFAYVMSEPHLSGYRVVIGYETQAEAMAAHMALARPSPGVSREEVAEALATAFEAGCLAVQNNYEPNPDPEFGEAASDYAASVIDALLSRGEG